MSTAFVIGPVSKEFLKGFHTSIVRNRTSRFSILKISTSDSYWSCMAIAMLRIMISRKLSFSNESEGLNFSNTFTLISSSKRIPFSSQSSAADRNG